MESCYIPTLWAVIEWLTVPNHATSGLKLIALFQFLGHPTFKCQFIRKDTRPDNSERIKWDLTGTEKQMDKLSHL